MKLTFLMNFVPINYLLDHSTYILVLIPKKVIHKSRLLLDCILVGETAPHITRIELHPQIPCKRLIGSYLKRRVRHQQESQEVCNLSDISKTFVLQFVQFSAELVEEVVSKRE